MRAKERWRQTDNKKILNCLCFEPRYEHACTQMPTNIDVCRRACVFVCLLGGKKYCSVVSLHNPHSLPLFCQSQLTNFYLQVQYTHTRPPIHLFSVPVFNWGSKPVWWAVAGLIEVFFLFSSLFPSTMYGLTLLTLTICITERWDTVRSNLCLVLTSLWQGQVLFHVTMLYYRNVNIGLYIQYSPNLKKGCLIPVLICGYVISMRPLFIYWFFLKKEEKELKQLFVLTKNLGTYIHDHSSPDR